MWWCVTRRYTVRPACLLAAAPGECHLLKWRVNKTAVALTASVTLLAHCPCVVVSGLCHEARGCCPVAWVRQTCTPGGWARAGCRALPRACCVAWTLRVRALSVTFQRNSEELPSADGFIRFWFSVSFLRVKLIHAMTLNPERGGRWMLCRPYSFIVCADSHNARKTNFSFLCLFDLLQ